MDKFDIVIIGSGLGGLECGYILSKKGYNVCILEKNSQLGGCLQTFKRGKTFFDTGFHYVGALDKDQSLYKLFKYFNLLNLPWHKMDDDGFAEVILKDKSYFFASGYDKFVDILSKDFPKQRTNLSNYAKFLKDVGNNIKNSFNPKKEDEFISSTLFERSAYSFLNETISDPLLRNVLSGASLTMELNKDTLPLYIFSQINSSFIQSSWRLKGGGSLIADKLTEEIKKMGGSVFTKTEVTKIFEDNGEISYVEINGKDKIYGNIFISNIHPALTLSLIPESMHIRKMYKKRISNLPNTYGMFTTHLKLKENSVPYLNRNIFMYKDDDLWDYSSYSTYEKIKGVLISYQVPKIDSKYTENIDILTPMQWNEVAKWKDTTIGKRGKEYEEFKLRKAEECINIVSERIPELKGNIEKIYTSTPLTYRDYTGTWEGSAYGVQKDYNRLMQTMLAPHTQIPNLLLTGQNLNLHGILGVSMTSILTCGRIVGMESLVRDLYYV